MKTKTYYQVKVSIETENEDGKVKKIKENYLIQAVSVTDAEVKMAEHFKNIQMDYTVKSISESNVVDVIE